MECEEVESRLWEYLDRELGRELARPLKSHLDECRGCRSAYCRDRAFLALIGRLSAKCSAPLALAARVHWCLRSRSRTSGC